MRISSFVLTALNDQAEHELSNEKKYRALASWAEFIGLTGCASFFRKQADGEHEHFLKVVSFIEDRNEKFVASNTIIPAFSPSTFREAFRFVYDLEIATTEKIYTLKQVAETSGDYSTCQWLMDPTGLIKEQVEEENIAQTILDRIGTMSGGLAITGSDVMPATPDGLAIDSLDKWIGEL